MKQKEIEKAKASLKNQFTRNLVAKQSRNKSGAGPHKSDKDYNRMDKQYKIDAEQIILLQETLAALKLEQETTRGITDLYRIEEEIQEIEDQLKEI